MTIQDRPLSNLRTSSYGGDSSGESGLFHLAQSSLNRKSHFSSIQNDVDHLTTGFFDQAFKMETVAPLFVGVGAGRLVKIGVMEMKWGGRAAPLKYALSVGLGTGSEAIAYELAGRGLQTLDSLQGNRLSSPSLWRWSGSGGLKEGFGSSFITFSAFKGAGHAGRGTNVVFQHTLASTAMVAGHQAAAAFEWIPPSQGSLSEQFFNAEITNLQLGLVMGLAHETFPVISRLERRLDLTFHSLETKRGKSNNTPLFGPEPLAVGEGPGESSSPPASSKSFHISLATRKGEGVGEKISFDRLLSRAEKGDERAVRELAKRAHLVDSSIMKRLFQLAKEDHPGALRALTEIACQNHGWVFDMVWLGEPDSHKRYEWVLGKLDVDRLAQETYSKDPFKSHGATQSLGAMAERGHREAKKAFLRKAQHLPDGILVANLADLSKKGLSWAERTLRTLRIDTVLKETSRSPASVIISLSSLAEAENSAAKKEIRNSQWVDRFLKKPGGWGKPYVLGIMAKAGNEKAFKTLAEWAHENLDAVSVLFDLGPKGRAALNEISVARLIHENSNKAALAHRLGLLADIKHPEALKALGVLAKESKEALRELLQRGGEAKEKLKNVDIGVYLNEAPHDLDALHLVLRLAEAGHPVAINKIKNLDISPLLQEIDPNTINSPLAVDLARWENPWAYEWLGKILGQNIPAFHFLIEQAERENQIALETLQKADITPFIKKDQNSFYVDNYLRPLARLGIREAQEALEKQEKL